jgi:hypothetical protein
MGIRNQTTKAGRVAGRAPRKRRLAADWTCVSDTVWAPPTGAYLTDETGLFRVADAFSNADELFLELENCATLGLVLCPARTVAKLGLRTVVPVSSAS